MNRELEIAAAASVGGWLGRRRGEVLPVGSPCPNCGAALSGPYCNQCGQLAETFHRSVWGLVAEAVESFFHYDGRVWRTLPRLLFRPGRLTRDYLDGRRASQIPPLRLFLVVLLLVFFLGELGDRKALLVVDGAGRPLAGEQGATKAREELTRGMRVTARGPVEQSALARWVEQRMEAAVRKPERFTAVVETWTHRLAVLLLPIGALLLSLLFVFQRRFFVYDHLIFSMHSLSFQGLLLSAGLLISMVTPLAALLLVFVPVHLFAHMRGVYATSVVGTLLRMALLFAGSLVGFAVLIGVLLWIGLSAMGGG